jgi:hypothetical protein
VCVSYESVEGETLEESRKSLPDVSNASSVFTELFKMKSVPQYIYYTYYVTMNDNEWDFQNFVPLAIKG